VTALFTLQPDILPFALLFSHKIYPRQAGSLAPKPFSYLADARQVLPLTDTSIFAFDAREIQQLFTDVPIQVS
jgi:hypothetical protein